MSTLRIAHFSDTHVLSLQGIGPKRFLNKRWTGAVNLGLNRSRHYRVDIFERLLEAVVAAKPDHSVCTGDLVNLALEPEFKRVGELLDRRFKPHELSLVPGNHDYYVKEAVDDRLFEASFGHWQPQDIQVEQGAAYPIARLMPGLAVIGVNSAIPTPVFMANGEVGDAQLDRLRATFENEKIHGRFRMLLIHHPLLPEPKRRFDVARRLNDAEALIGLLKDLGAQGPDLIIHGHNHEFKRMSVPGVGTPIIQVASASRSGKRHRAEFNVYVISDGRLESIERHIHQPETGRFLPCDESGHPLGQSLAG